MDKRSCIRLDDRYARSEGILCSSHDDETIMMSVEMGEYYGLKGVSDRIWTLLERPRTVSALCDLLMEQYRVERGVCERDILGFLADLEARGVIRRI